MIPSTAALAKHKHTVQRQLPSLAHIYKHTQTSLMHAVVPIMKKTRPEQKRTKWSSVLKWRCLPSKNFHTLHSRVMTLFSPGGVLSSASEIHDSISNLSQFPTRVSAAQNIGKADSKSNVEDNSGNFRNGSETHSSVHSETNFASESSTGLSTETIAQSSSQHASTSAKVSSNTPKGLELDPSHPRYPLPPLPPPAARFDFIQNKLRRIGVSSKALRTIDKHAGIDNYLLRTPDRELGAAGIRMRQELKTAIHLLQQRIEDPATSPDIKEKLSAALPSPDARRDHRLWLSPVKKALQESSASAEAAGAEDARQLLAEELQLLSRQADEVGAVYELPLYLRDAVEAVDTENSDYAVSDHTTSSNGPSVPA